MAALFGEMADYGSSSSVTAHQSSPCSTYSSPTTSPPPIDPHEEPDPAECLDNESNQPSTAFLNLISRIPTKNTIKFNTPNALAGHIQRRIRWCYQDGNGSYVLVTQVTEELVTVIDDAFHERGIDKIVRCTYEHLINALVIRFMPGAAHENTAGGFIFLVQMKVVAIPGHTHLSFRSVGATRISVPGKRSKEGDAGLKPADTRKAEKDWPSFMVEVGYSESLAELRDDAHWWLIESKGQTRMVVLIKVRKHPCSLTLECWELLRDTPKEGTSSRTRRSPQRTQHFDINATGTVTHHHDYPDLIIPYLIIFDLPHDSATDVVISRSELSAWASHIFAGFE